MAGMSDLKKQCLKNQALRAEYERLGPETAMGLHVSQLTRTDR